MRQIFHRNGCPENKEPEEKNIPEEVEHKEGELCERLGVSWCLVTLPDAATQMWGSSKVFRNHSEYMGVLPFTSPTSCSHISRSDATPHFFMQTTDLKDEDKARAGRNWAEEI